MKFSPFSMHLIDAPAAFSRFFQIDIPYEFAIIYLAIGEKGPEKF